MVLEWDSQQACIGLMVKCPKTFGYIVYTDGIGIACIKSLLFVTANP